ncbi:MAG: DUF1508 domain-containing protein [Dehalococcoidia bacterium]|nr:DUF1508 domain-containing protein [Dehalococcoidia bacterium]
MATNGGSKSNKNNAQNGIESAKKNATEAVIEDKTVQYTRVEAN